MTRIARALVLSAVALFAAGCGAGSPGTTSPTSATPAPSAATASPAVTSPATPAPTRPPTPGATAETTEPPGGAIYDPTADPAADIAAAMAAAAADGKPILLDFGADWCPDCIVLARMFEMPAFAEYLAGVHVVRIDVGFWDHNLDVSAAYGDPISVGIPAVVLVSPAGEVLGSTADGRLASAASMTPEAVLAVLRSLGD
ncbi:MAG: thioredoxin family protein [Chloroflexota bacterium]